MSDKSGQEKTEQPTEHRLKKLRERGSVPKSKDLPSAAALLGIFLALGAIWPDYFARLGDFILMPIQYFGKPFHSAIRALLQSALINFTLLILPPISLAVILAILAHIVQFGVIFSFEPVKIQMNRINPSEGLKNLFSFARMMEAIKSVIKTALMLSTLWLVLHFAIPKLIMLNPYGLNGVMAMLGRLMGQMSVYCMIIFLSLSIFDVFIQNRIFKRENKMSKDEVKRDWKEMEGDPLIKGRRRQLFRELVNSPQIPFRVEKASVVVTNPTHYAVAIYYRYGITDLPVVIAKGMDKAAAKIIATARRSYVPVVQNAPLARKLFSAVRVNDYISSEFVVPVAEILSRYMTDVSNSPYKNKEGMAGPTATDSELERPRTTRFNKPPIKKR